MMLLSLVLYMKSISLEYRGKPGIKSVSKLPSFTRRMTLCGCCVLKPRWREREERSCGGCVPEPRGHAQGRAFICHKHTNQGSVIIYCPFKPCDFLSSVEHKRRRLDGCSRCSCAMTAKKHHMTCALQSSEGLDSNNDTFKQL